MIISSKLLSLIMMIHDGGEKQQYLNKELICCRFKKKNIWYCLSQRYILIIRSVPLDVLSCMRWSDTESRRCSVSFEHSFEHTRTLLRQGVSVYAVSYRHLLRRERDHTLLWETPDYNWCRIYFWYPEKTFCFLISHSP